MDYSATKNTATALIKKFGIAATMSTLSAGAYNFSTGAVSGQSSTNTTVYVVMLDYPKSRGHQSNINAESTEVKGTRKKFLMSSSVAPQVDGTLTVNNVVYSIVAFTDISPASTTSIYYEVYGEANG